jgi:hypothetical protein
MTTPSFDNIQPQFEHSVKTVYKHKMGTMASETYFDKDGFPLANVELKLKGLSPEVHQEWIRVNRPFFEDPVSPQLTLFPETNE